MSLFMFMSAVQWQHLTNLFIFYCELIRDYMSITIRINQLLPFKKVHVGEGSAGVMNLSK